MNEEKSTRISLGEAQQGKEENIDPRREGEAKSAHVLRTLTPLERKELQSRIKSTSVKVESGCWNWILGKNKRGYGYTYVRGIAIGAHRISFAAFRSGNAHELLTCHHCDNPACVNPHHMFLGTDKENMQDMVKKGRANSGRFATRTHCKRGHKFTPETTTVSGKSRWCKICSNMVRNQRRHLQKPLNKDAFDYSI